MSCFCSAVVVLQGSTVRDVMQAVQRAVERDGKLTSSTDVSWKYVWRRYWLACGQVQLEDEHAKLTKFVSR